MAVTGTFKKLDSDLNLNISNMDLTKAVLRSRGLLPGAGADLKFDLASEKRND